MPKLVILITPLIDDAHTVADAWQQAGTPGVTFIESYGMRRLQEATHNPEVLPGIMSMIELLRNREENSVTLMSVVQDSAMADRLIDAARQIVGDLNGPDNGILFVIDVERAVGLRPYSSG
ncbi:MAG: hypothetical protein K8J31_01545 [Anaerolineae bacterium]|nr:hypothetical protein [Anaerolineae bacterium]